MDVTGLILELRSERKEIDQEILSLERGLIARYWTRFRTDQGFNESDVTPNAGAALAIRSPTSPGANCALLQFRDAATGTLRPNRSLVPHRCLVFLVLLAAVLRGQDVARFNADSTLVLIPVSVTDHSNRFVLGLRKQDFRILEDGVEQPVVNLSGEDTPLSIGLLYDRSGSMGDKQSTS